MAYSRTTDKKSRETSLESFFLLSSDDDCDVLMRVKCRKKKTSTLEDEVSFPSERDKLCSNNNSTECTHNISSSDFNGDVHSLSLMLGNILSDKNVLKKKRTMFPKQRKEKLEIKHLCHYDDHITSESNNNDNSSTPISCTPDITSSSDTRELSTLLDNVIYQRKLKKKNKKIENRMQTIDESSVEVLEESENCHYLCDEKRNRSNSKDNNGNEREEVSFLSQTLDKIMTKKKKKLSKSMHYNSLSPENPVIDQAKQNFRNTVRITLNNCLMDGDTDSSSMSSDIIKPCDISLQVSLTSNDKFSYDVSLCSEFSSDCSKKSYTVGKDHQVHNKVMENKMNFSSSIAHHEVEVSEKQFNRSTSTDHSSFLSNEVRSYHSLENRYLYKTALDGFLSMEDQYTPVTVNYDSSHKKKVINSKNGFDISSDSSDENYEIRMDLKSQEKRNSFSGNALDNKIDECNFANSDTPVKPLPLYGKTVPARYPISRIQNIKRSTSTGSLNTYSFLQSLSCNVPDYCRHHDSIKYIKSFKKYKEDLTKKLFKLYNDTVFDMQLPDEIPIVWNSRLLKTAGYCAYRKNKHSSNERSARIELSIKVCDSAERLRDTLIHEMCHAAVWLLCGANDGHGPYWKLYAKKANRIHPELPVIMRCHNYEISHKFIYKCTGCQYKIGRHSKSIDTKTKMCGLCSSPFELHVTSKKGVLTPVNSTVPHTPNKFALFVKENYASVKKENKGIKHKDVMSHLSKEFAAKIDHHCTVAEL